MSFSHPHEKTPESQALSYLKLAEKVARIGHWRIDFDNKELFWSDEIFNIHGVDRDCYTPDVKTAVEFYHPEDRDDVHLAIEKALKKPGPFEFVLRIVRRSREIRFVHARAECQINAVGRVGAIFGVFQDITEKREADLKLKQSEERFERAVNGSSVGLWDWDIASGDLYWSPRFQHFLGITITDFKPSYADFEDRIHMHDRKRVVAAIDGHLADDTPLDIEFRMKREDDTFVWLHVSGQAVWDADGSAIRMAGSVQDISIAVAMREELESQRAELQLIFDNVPARISYKDDENRFVRLNQRAAAAMGLTVDEAEGACINDLFPEIANKYHDDDLSVINSGMPKLGIIEEFRSEEGERGWVQTDKIPYTDSETGKRFILAVSTDVTKQRLTEEKLRASENRFALAASGASVGIWDWSNVEEDEQWWSKILYELFGLDPTFVPASLRNFKKLIHPDDQAAAQDMLDRHFRNREPFHIEVRIKHGDGGYRWFLSSGQAIWDQNGKPQRMVGTVMDINDLKTTQEQLQERTTTLERTNEDLQNFAYIASHDLRAPLRGMDNVAQWIEEDLGDAVPAGVQKKLYLMRNRIDRMDKLLRDILEYSRAGQRSEPPQATNTQSVLADVIEWVAAPEGFTIKATMALPTIMVSTSLFEQVLTNLISNAVKHHDQSRGTISIAYAETSDFHEFVVTDDGPGISPEFHDRVFKMFQTLRRRDEVEGSGIGLAIVKKMIEASGGMVWISSPPHQRGSSVHFTFPKPERLEIAS
ncbi:MAG: PAS domain-containing protein [Pseudomonadota bacterium]